MKLTKEQKIQKNKEIQQKEKAFIYSLGSFTKIGVPLSKIDKNDTLQLSQSLFDVKEVITAQKRYKAALRSNRARRKIEAFRQLILVVNTEIKKLKKQNMKSVGLNKIFHGQVASLKEITTLLQIEQ